MAGRGAHQRIVFDLGDPMGQSTCVGCGECVQACPTGALLPASVVDDQGTMAHRGDRQVDSLCPYCGVGCQLTFHIERERILHVEGRDGPANHGRLCVKGRFGFDYIHHPGRLTVPLIRKEGVPKRTGDAGRPAPSRGRTSARRRGTRPSTARPRDSAAIRDAAGPGRARRVRLGQGVERGGVPVPEAGAHGLRQQQRRPLHAALPRLERRRADGDDRLGRGDGLVLGVPQLRRDHRHRRQPGGEPSRWPRRSSRTRPGAGRS